jgi:hypothetical protein
MLARDKHSSLSAQIGVKRKKFNMVDTSATTIILFAAVISFLMWKAIDFVTINYFEPIQILVDKT